MSVQIDDIVPIVKSVGGRICVGSLRPSIVHVNISIQNPCAVRSAIALVLRGEKCFLLKLIESVCRQIVQVIVAKEVVWMVCHATSSSPRGSSGLLHHAPTGWWSEKRMRYAKRKRV